MRPLILVLAVSLLGCATTTSSSTPTLPVYTPDPLPTPIEEREAKSLPPKTGEPTAIEKDKPAPFTGILLDSYLLAKYKLIKAERDRVRLDIQIERDSRKQVQQYYNTVLTDALKRAERSWWERHASTIGILGGSLATAAIAIGLAFGLNASK